MKKINLLFVASIVSFELYAHASNAQNTTQNPQNMNREPNQQLVGQSAHPPQTQNQNHQAIIPNYQAVQTQNQQTITQATYPDLAKKTPKQIARFNHSLRCFESCYIKALRFSSGIEDEHVVSNLSEQEIVDIAIVFSGLNKKGEKFTILGDKTISNYLDLCALFAHAIKELEDKIPAGLQNK